MKIDTSKSFLLMGTLLGLSTLACVAPSRSSSPPPRTTTPPATRANLGQPCGATTACVSGLVCADNICQNTCTSDDMCGAQELCASYQPGGPKVCRGGAGVTCDLVPDPQSFCASALGLPAADVACEAGSCVEAGCTFDDQCPAEDVCIAGACVHTCAAEADCAPIAGTSCLRRTDGGAGQVCRAPRNSEPCDAYPDPEAYCADLLGVSVDRAICDAVDGACVEAVETTLLMITDVSAGPDACSDSVPEFSPGTDIIYLALADSQDQILGYGRAVRYVQEATFTNFYTGLDHLDGGAPDVDLDGCPNPDELDRRFREDTVVSLGCGGKLVVEFLDARGVPIALQSGMRVEIGAFYPACEGGEVASPDAYTAQLCPGIPANDATPETGCTQELIAQPTSGLSYIELP